MLSQERTHNITEAEIPTQDSENGASSFTDLQKRKQKRRKAILRQVCASNNVSEKKSTNSAHFIIEPRSRTIYCILLKGEE